ncbi:ABC transporter permease [Paenibacillus tarimensis]|uniref:ABC transporter permease n=1 Tax=Paenibacillus tarimensis TaxID=416012 RepID=UPI001F443112|nr:iron ABC transporter permease [Paenibacillus tarimensis]MCF2946169.1 iron ABC transporter permease [Paenibacillus tarimensis]
MNSIPTRANQKQGIGRSDGGPSLYIRIVLRKTWLFILLLVLLFCFIIPLLKLMLLSFEGQGSFGLSSYTDVLKEPRTWKTFKDTLWIVAGSTMVSAVCGIGAAWVMAYTDIRGKQALHLVMLLSFILPSYVLTLSWASFLGNQGMAAQLLRLFDPGARPFSIYSYGGIIFVMGLHHFPLVYLLTLNVLKKIPRDLEWAGRVSGTGRWKAFFRITLPLAMPGFAGGTLLAFLASLDNFGIPAFLGIPVGISVLSTLIYEEIAGFGPSAFSRAAVLSILLGLLALVGTLMQWTAVRRIRTGDSVKEDDSPRIRLGRYRVWLEVLLWGGFALITFVPLLSMAATSLKRAYGLPFTWSNVTLTNYKYVLFDNPRVWEAVETSLMLAFVTLVSCLVAGTALAYASVRRPSWFTKLAESAISIPYTLPGIVFGLMMILAWMEPVPGWNPGIYGTAGILLIAYFCRFLILQVRASVSAIMQVDPSTEEASRMFGAGSWKLWRYVLLPQLLPGLAGGALLVFLTALTELTVSALLWSPGSRTIGVTIFNFEQAGDTAYSTALSSLIVLLVLIGFGLLQLVKRLSGRQEEGS